ncbi:DMT family transporter [Nonomuraea muscovyensis]|uniref:Drug/metabolite transporter (DMT)-like permease n=1 Tax=Nonomuraea muscovyensis TaxID=1124761 RepID=A0A7X0F2K7_9ACTN|nr:DMT family transporter [Nonomuraea muscovyensis]MBB6351379.1 drug/metabolite transporter (DMT)-like permease [Nonomuraea muscovyensis]
MLIALVGALGYALGAALQQYEAVAQGASLKLVRRPRWWIGGAIGFTGACLHAVALSLAPLVAVQPISVATLVFAVPLAAFMYGRRPYRAEILGSVAVAVGLLWLMLLVPSHNVTPRLSDGAALGFVGVIGVIVLVAQLLANRLHGPGRALLLAVGAGATTASVSTFVRVVGGGLEGDLGRLLHWFTLAVPVLLVCAVVLLQRSYAVGYFGIAYAGVQVIDPITSVLAGAILLGEPLPASPSTAVPALLAGALTIGGTITLGRLAPDHSQPKPVDATPAPRPLSATSDRA